jgi:outer membrane autotransporter protein
MEVPVYAELPAVVRQLGIEQLGTFHDRQGRQSLLSQKGRVAAAWGRVWGGHNEQRQGGDARSRFDGNMVGLQVGHDLYADASADGHRNHYGAYFGYARARGDVSGNALGFSDYSAGRITVDSYSVGGYWTHVGPSGWYTDAVVQGSRLTIDPLSHRGIGAETDGKALAASFEAGIPLALSARWTLEPQAQLIWQRVWVDSLDDGISTVSFQGTSGWLGRIGARLETSFDSRGVQWQPWLRVNLLRSFGGSDEAHFGATTIGTSVRGTAGQIGAGVAANLGKHSALYATVGYTTNLDGNQRDSIFGNLGMRWRW